MGKNPTDITGRIVRHIFDLRRFENSLAKRTAKLLKKSEDDAIRRIIAADIGMVQRFPAKQRRLKRVVDGMRTMINQNFLEMERFARKEILKLVNVESEFAATNMRTAIGTDAGIKVLFGEQVIGPGLLKQIVDAEPFRGLTLSDWWSKQKAATRSDFKQRVQIGMLQGESTDEIVRRIRGLKSNNFKDGLFAGKSRRSVETLVRTAVNQVSNRASFETYKKNRDITDSYEYVATLDDRTSPVCSSLDGRIFKYDDPARRVPPQHPACRSTTVPVVNWNKLGLRPPPPGLRAAKGGPVSSRTTYKQWLKNQPAVIQDDILGPTRGKLFRSGKASLDDFVRTDGRMLTLDELRARSELGPGEPQKPKGRRLKSLARVLAKKKQLAAALGFEGTRGVDEIINHVRDGRRDRLEYGTLLDAQGNVLDKVKGKVDETDITRARKIVAGEGSLKNLLHVHNHPGGSDFSGKDIAVLAVLKNMAVVGHNGRVLKMRLAEKTPSGKQINPLITLKIAQEYAIIKTSLNFKFDAILLKKVTSGIPEAQASREANLMKLKEATKRLMKTRFKVSESADGKIETMTARDILNHKELRFNFVKNFL